MDQQVTSVADHDVDASGLPGEGERAFTTGELAERLGGELRGSGAVRISGVNAVHDATIREMTFINDDAHVKYWSESQAGAVVVSAAVDEESFGQAHSGDRPWIVVPDAEIAMITLLELFAHPPPNVGLGVHETAVIAAGVEMGEGVRIGPLASVAQGCRLGDRVTLHAGVHVYEEAVIGDDCILHSGVVIRERCVLGRRVTIHQNSSVGADGFGYRPAPDGSGLLKVPHLGTVHIEDEVEIGANTCIDRAKFGVTRIGAGTKIDNLVQVAHNVVIGRDCLIAGAAAFSGSVIVGDRVLVSGQVGVADHVTIGDEVQIGAQSGLIGDIAAGETVLGMPARNARKCMRQWAALSRLPDLIQQMNRSK